MLHDYECVYHEVSPSCLLTLQVRRIRFDRDGFRWAAAVPVHAAAVQGDPRAEPTVGLHPRGAGRAGDALRQGRQYQVQRRRQPQPGLHRIRECPSLLPMLTSPEHLVLLSLWYTRVHGLLELW
jgi:hypothetical protein